MAKRKNIIITVIGLCLLVATLVYVLNKQSAGSINTYDECVAAGNPVMDSYPEQCSANGRIFVNN